MYIRTMRRISAPPPDILYSCRPESLYSVRAAVDAVSTAEGHTSSWMDGILVIDLGLSQEPSSVIRPR